MPGKRSKATAPGVSTTPDTPGVDAALIQEALGLLENGGGPEQLTALWQRDPVRFDETCAGLLDELARTDIHWFASTCLKDQRGDFLNPRPLDHFIQGHIDQCKRDGKYAGILAPVGCGKTVQVSLVRVLWDIAQNPHALVKIVCATDKTAVKRLKLISRIIMYDPDFKRVFGHRVFPAESLVKSQDPWNNHQVTIARSGHAAEPTIEAYGILSSVAGARCSLLIFDDPIDQRATMISPAQKETVHDKIHNEWLSRKFLDDHHIIWICTRWTDDDESGRLMQNPNWRFMVIRVSEDFERLDVEYIEKERVIAQMTCPIPTHWSSAMLRNEFQSMGEIAFNRMYRQKAYSKSDRMFRHFADCLDEHLDVPMAGEMARREKWPCYVGVDLSSSKRPGTAVITVAIDPKENKRYLVDVRVGKWGPVELSAALNDVWARYSPIVVRVENNSVQEFFHGFVKGDTRTFPWAAKLEPFTTTAKAKWDLETGVMAMDLEFANRNWAFPAKAMQSHEFTSGEHVSRCGECRFLRELEDYPMFPTNDLVMAFWIARSGLEAYDARIALALQQMIKNTPSDPFWNEHGGGEFL